MAFRYSPKIVTDGLVLCLDAANTKSFVSGSTTWNDLTKNLNNGSLINGPTYSGLNGGSFNFDGLDDLIELPSITGLTDFTISLWFQSTGLGGTGSVIYNSLIGQSSNRRILVSTQSSKAILVQMGGSNYQSTTPCPFNVWNNVTYTYDSINDIAQLYVNNIKQTSQSNSSVTFNDVTFFLGSWSNPIADYAMKGYISSFFMYNRKLSDDEVTNNYNTLRGRFGR